MWETSRTMSSGTTSRTLCVKVRLPLRRVKSWANVEIAGEVLFADVLLLPNGMSKVTKDGLYCS